MSASEREARRAVLWTAASAALLCAVIAALHRASPRTAISAHGMLHAALLERVLAHPGELPPENPFFAGEPVLYYWVFHALGAAIAAVTGLDPLRSLELLVMAGAVALFAGCAAFARSLFGRAAAGPWVALLVLAGAKPFAAEIVAWRRLRGGPAVLEGEYLWGLVHPVMRAMRLFDPYSLWGPLLNFFYNVTSRPLAIASLVLVVVALRAVLARGGAARAAGLALATAACSSFSMLFGASTTGALGGALVALAGSAYWRSRRASGGAAPAGEPAAAPLGASLVARAPLALGAIAAGFALSVPTFANILGGGAGGGLAAATPGEMKDALLAMAESALVTLPLAVVATRGASGDRRDFLALLVLASLVYMAGAAVVSLPMGSQNNFFQAALVPLGMAASGALVDAEGRVAARRALLVAALFVPTALLITAAYAGRPPVPLASEHGELRRLPPGAPLPSLYAWLRESAAPDAVVVVDPGPPIRAMSGNTNELPAMTGRSLFTLRASHYIVSDHADVARRVAIARALVAGAPLGDDDARYVAALGREVYVLLDGHGATSDPATRAAADAAYGAPAFEAGPIALYRWPRAAGPPAGAEGARP
ncbi:MAG: DUF2298 domain-containing protein [Myxococcota bacterium]